MSSNIIYSKLFKPPITSDILCRERLIKDLNENFHKPLTIICAPAGYGKSILASTWLDQIDTQFGWISLNTNDNHLTSFLLSLENCLNSIFEKEKYDFKTLIPAINLPKIAEIGKIFINNVSLIHEPLVFVFDDYHLLKNESIHAFIDFVLKYCPEHFKICILSRTLPEIELNKLKLYNQLNFLGVEDLIFMEDEIKKLYIQINKHDLSYQDIKDLKELTEGWILSLRLSILALDNANKNNLLNYKQNDQSLIEDYLVTEVLKNIPTWIKKGLLISSILSRFNENLVQSIFKIFPETDEKSADAFISYLIKTNLFIIPLDDSNYWFRYHHLFQDLLIKELNLQFSSDEISKIYESAYLWLEQEGYYDESIHYALLANNPSFAISVIESHWRNSMNLGNWHEVVHWLSKIKQSEIESSQQLLLAKTWQYYYHYDIAGVSRNIEILKTLIKHPDDLIGEIALFLGYVDYFSNRSESGLNNILIALKHIDKRDVEFRSQSEILYGLTSQMLGNGDTYLEHIKQWVKQKEHMFPLRKSCLLWAWAFTTYTDGKLDEAYKVGKELERFSDSACIDNFTGWGAYLQGLVFLQKGDFESAVTKLSVAEQYKYAQFSRGAIDSISALTLSFGLLGKLGDANKALNGMHNLNDSLGSIFNEITQYVSLYLLDIEGKHELVNKKLSTIEPPSESAAMGWWFIQPCMIRCSLILKEGSKDHLDLATEYLNKYITLNSESNNIIQVIPLKVLKACLLIKKGKKNEALEELKDAMLLNPESKILYPFIRHYDQISELFHLIPSDIAPESFKNQVSRIYEKTRSNDYSNNHSKKIPSSAVFSFREVEVIEYLALGLKNKEIAEELFISENTVKKHLKSIYAKLNVHSRMEAIVAYSKL